MAKSTSRITAFGSHVAPRRGRSPRQAAAGTGFGGRFEFTAYTPILVHAKLRGLIAQAANAQPPERRGWTVFADYAVATRNMLPVSYLWKLQEALPLQIPKITSLLLSQVVPKFATTANNIVVNTGLDDILDKYFKGSSYSAAHYIGLMSGTPSPAAGHTMASHAGWSEITNYDEAARQTFTTGAVSSQSINNSGSKAVVTASSGGFTAGGAFLTTNSTKGGTAGTLVSAAAFTGGNEALDEGDTLTITYTFGAADDGV